MFWGQVVVRVSWSFPLLFLLVIWNSCAVSSNLMSIGVRPLIIHSASFETVQKILLSWSLMSFILQLSFARAFIQIGAPYCRRGSMPPVYIVFSAPWPSPQFNLAVLESAKISFEYLSVIYYRWSYVSFLSIIIPKYFRFVRVGGDGNSNISSRPSALFFFFWILK